MFEEIGVINPHRKRATHRKARKNPARRPKKVRRNPVGALAAANPRRPSRRKYRVYARPTKRTSHAVLIDPIEKDIVSTLKTGALIAAGAIGGVALAAFTISKWPSVADNKWAAPAIMAGGGIGIGMILKGHNKALATKVGLGAVGMGMFTVISPYLAGKVPGFDGAATAIPATIPASTAGFGAYVAAGRGFDGYTSALPIMSGMGALDPYAYYDQ